jgi:hypothetical protein
VPAERPQHVCGRQPERLTGCEDQPLGDVVGVHVHPDERLEAHTGPLLDFDPQLVATQLDDEILDTLVDQAIHAAASPSVRARMGHRHPTGASEEP